MRHLRKDYDRIQDPHGKIGEDEPVILIRGRDQFFMTMLLQYIDLNYAAHNDEVAGFFEGQLDGVRDWIGRNRDKVKLADVPLGVPQGFPS